MQMVDSDRAACQRCEALKDLGQLEAAIACYQGVVDRYPDSAWAVFQLGRALQQQGQITGAVTCYQRSIDLDPEMPYAYSPLRFAPLPNSVPILKDLVEWYRLLIQRHPAIAALSLNLAALLTRLNQLDAAKIYYQRAVYQQLLADYPRSWVEQVWKPSGSGKPDFIIIGAPRCGTTSLYRYMTCHPQILAAAEKELRFFSQEFDRGLDWYQAQFPTVEAAEPYLTGEATPTYLAHPHAADRLAQCFPATKLIVLLRDPIQRAFSHYQMLVRRGTEVRSFETAMSEELACLSGATAVDLAQGLHWKSAEYLTKSLYVHSLRHWLDFFPRSQLLILQSERFYADPASTLHTIYDWLGLPDHPLPHYAKYNAAVYAPMAPAIAERLRSFVQPHNDQLMAEFHLNAHLWPSAQS